MEPPAPLVTDRLIIRPLEPSDAATIQVLANDWDVANTTMNLPHPYVDGLAEQWIAATHAQLTRGESITFGITLQTTGEVVGAISLAFRRQMESAELGYWIGKPYWGNGFATEAGRAVLDYAFRTLNLNRVFARFMARNPASGHVMEKIGMQYEGTLRQHEKKWGMFEDIVFYGALRDEYLKEHPFAGG